jgi:hypothetical protein
MSYISNRFVVALLLVVLASATAFAKGHTATITLKHDTKIGEVLVEKGTYQVKFDEQANELSIWKGKKLIAKSAVELQPRPKTVNGTEHMVVAENGETKLVNVTFGGSHQTMVLKPTATQATIKN